MEKFNIPSLDEAKNIKEKFNDLELLKSIPIENENIKELDPLNLDSFFKNKFTSLVKEGREEQLEEVLTQSLSFHPQDDLEAKAFLRDVGMVMASLKRINPIWGPSQEL